MQLQYILCVIFILMKSLFMAEKFQYLSTEHPEVTYYNPKYISSVSITSQRHGRRDPFYYVRIYAHILNAWGNNVTANFYFYEWLTNVYKRSFVEMHFKFCDLIENDKFFGSAMKQGKLATLSCPYPPGDYYLYNMTVPVKHIPPHFPFKKGRIYANATITDTNEIISSGYIDMEIKEFSSSKKNKIKD